MNGKKKDLVSNKSSFFRFSFLLFAVARSNKEEVINKYIKIYPDVNGLTEN